MYFCAEGGVLYDKDKQRIVRYPTKIVNTSFITPNTIKEIEACAFADCMYLQSVFIPESVNTIGRAAFWNCQSIMSINLPDTVVELGYGAFSGCSSLKQINIPQSVMEVTYNLFKGCTSVEKIIIPHTVKIICSGAFYGCTSVREIHCSIIAPDELTIQKYIGNESEIFGEINEESCILYVPSGTLDKYQHHPIFSRFQNIREQRILHA